MMGSGVIVYFDELEKLDVRIEDIKRGVTNICRYAGQLSWRLLWHLALCVELAKHHLERGNIKNKLTVPYVAMHDWHEVYVTDIPAGFKKYLSSYSELEYAAEKRVHEVFCFDIEDRPDEVKCIDMRALVIEMTCLGHSAASICGERYGVEVTQEEIEIFKRIQQMDDEEAWKVVLTPVILTLLDIARSLRAQNDIGK